MAIARKKKVFVGCAGVKASSDVPTYTCEELGLNPSDVEEVHELTLNAKTAKSKLDAENGQGGKKKEIFDAIRKKMFEGGGKSAYIDVTETKQVLVKTNTRLFALDEQQVDLITEVIEAGGHHDAGDYYHESQSVGYDADLVYERLGEKGNDKFVDDFRKLLAKHGVGDLVKFASVVMPREGFHDIRMALPPKVNMAIEGIKPTSLSLQAKTVL